MGTETSQIDVAWGSTEFTRTAEPHELPEGKDRLVLKLLKTCLILPPGNETKEE